MQKGKARHFLLWVGFIEKTRREKPGARIRCNLDTKNGSEKATKPKTLTLEDQAFFFTFFDCGWSLRSHGVAERRRSDLGNLIPI